MSARKGVAAGAQARRRLARWVAACAFVLGACSMAGAAERYAVVVSGASGGAKYAAVQGKRCDDLVGVLTTTFGFSESNIVVLREDREGSSRPTADNVRRLFADLGRRMTRDDTLFVVLFGHGTVDGVNAKFNLVGPDLDAHEWKDVLESLAGLVVVVNTTESSSPFIEALSGRGRVVITATDSTAQSFATIFPDVFIRALGEASSDTDRDGRISVWEAFAAASAGVAQYYEQRGQLSIERSVLDDDGDGVGREARGPGSDGVVARGVYFNAASGVETGDAVRAGLERRREALVAQVEALRARRASMTDQEYQAELERLFVELARVAQQIRERS